MRRHRVSKYQPPGPAKQVRGSARWQLPLEARCKGQAQPRTRQRQRAAASGFLPVTHSKHATPARSAGGIRRRGHPLGTRPHARGDGACVGTPAALSGRWHPSSPRSLTVARAGGALRRARALTSFIHRRCLATTSPLRAGPLGGCQTARTAGAPRQSPGLWNTPAQAGGRSAASCSIGATRAAFG